MKTRLLLLKYDLKGLGMNLYIPIASTCLCAVMLTLCHARAALTMDVVLFLINYILAPMCAWYILFIYQPVFEYDGGELFWTFPQSSIMVGIGRAFWLMVLYWLEVTLILGGTLFLLQYEGLLWRIIRDVVLLSFFFAGLAYCAMVFSNKVGTSITMVLGYIFLCIFLKRNIPDWFIVFAVEESSFMTTAVKTIPWGSLLWLIAQEKLAHAR